MSWWQQGWNLPNQFIFGWFERFRFSSGWDTYFFVIQSSKLAWFHVLSFSFELCVGTKSVETEWSVHLHMPDEMCDTCATLVVWLTVWECEKRGQVHIISYFGIVSEKDAGTFETPLRKLKPNIININKGFMIKQGHFQWQYHFSWNMVLI